MSVVAVVNTTTEISISPVAGCYANKVKIKGKKSKLKIKKPISIVLP